MSKIEQSKITQDLSKERRFTAFLEKNIFPLLAERRIYAEKVENRTLDFRGVDCCINGALVDIKAHELFQDELPRRYSFEKETRNWCVKEKQYGNVVDGWLVNKRKITEKYLFCYYQQSENKITGVKLMLVDRAKIINMMKEKGVDVTLTAENLQNIASHAVAQENGSVKYYFNGVTDISLTRSYQLPEEPLNVVVRYDSIRKICDWYREFNMEVPVEW